MAFTHDGGVFIVKASNTIFFLSLDIENDWLLPTNNWKDKSQNWEDEISFTANMEDVIHIWSTFGHKLKTLLCSADAFRPQKASDEAPTTETLNISTASKVTVLLLCLEDPAESQPDQSRVTRPLTWITPTGHSPPPPSCAPRVTWRGSTNGSGVRSGRTLASTCRKTEQLRYWEHVTVQKKNDIFSPFWLLGNHRISSSRKNHFLVAYISFAQGSFS